MPGRVYTSSDQDYKFGFNGQEHDNEVYGKGNLTTAKHWEYETRLGRRLNLDPVDQVSVSNYACFTDNPILFIDLLGNKPTTYVDENGKIMFLSNDNLDNRVVVVGNDKKDALMDKLESIQDNSKLNSNVFNENLRNYGSNYLVDGLIDLYNYAIKAETMEPVYLDPQGKRKAPAEVASHTYLDGCGNICVGYEYAIGGLSSSEPGEILNKELQKVSDAHAHSATGKELYKIETINEQGDRRTSSVKPLHAPSVKDYVRTSEITNKKYHNLIMTQNIFSSKMINAIQFKIQGLILIVSLFYSCRSTNDKQLYLELSDLLSKDNIIAYSHLNKDSIKVYKVDLIYKRRVDSMFTILFESVYYDLDTIIYLQDTTYVKFTPMYSGQRIESYEHTFYDGYKLYQDSIIARLTGNWEWQEHR